ncbi:HtaA domain-containing protein [Streptomyces sp. G44]|uniref:HtaA domain-containing protein n=1 Tax=Streptomyces sp. G44 TaxID=2807632 RepID=UPI001960A24B|nr:HtaA domain-containing protein [Streptomyces sp. G44]MBM7171006.1 HtaA domain-containing protein [Streptomyces sp. G44]
MSRNRRPLVLAAAVATAVTLGASALALPALAADSGGKAGPPKLELKDGTLDWGLKESFRKYVAGMAHGTIEATDGAKQAAGNGVFTFTGGTGTYDTGTHATATTFKGAVRFASTAHRFDIKIADVRVRTEGKTGAIQADVTLNGATQNDIDLAALDLSAVRPGQGEGGAMTFKDIPTTLTADGAKAFNGMYQAGDKLDPATLTVKAATGAPTGKPTSKPTDKPTDKPTSKPTGEPAPTPTRTTTPTGTPTTPERPAGQVVDGSLSWGLKKSFRAYISAGGKVTVAGGAEKVSGGYTFPHTKAAVDSGAKKIDASFGGSVRFTYKAHGIDMRFSDLKVRTNGSKGTLLVDVTTPKGTNNDVKFATLDLSKSSYRAKGDIVRLTKVPAAFTAAGAQQFANGAVGSMYKAGQRIDPVTVALSLSEGARLPVDGGGSGDAAADGTGTTGSGSVGSGSVGSGSAGGDTVGGGTGAAALGDAGSLASTGADIPSAALLGTAGAAVAAGAGAVYLARRKRGAELA